MDRVLLTALPEVSSVRVESVCAVAVEDQRVGVRVVGRLDGAADQQGVVAHLDGPFDRAGEDGGRVGQYGLAVMNGVRDVVDRRRGSPWANRR
jgi:hypothetical protein